MKKQFFYFLVVILILFFNCAVEQKKADEKKDENTVTPVTVFDPFPEILYKDMVSIAGGTYIQSDGVNFFTHTISNFSIGKYEVTYELWYRVYQWALANGYAFANTGIEGDNGVIDAEPLTYEPVTSIHWRDAMVWCNAYSEMVGFTPCYTDGGTVIKDSRDTNATACDGAVCSWGNNGFRLPSEGEWQFAASNKGTTPWNYASGAAADITDEVETKKVAWYNANALSHTHNVGTTESSSALTIWDMSGNVSEWCWDWYVDYFDPVIDPPQTDYRGPASGSSRVSRGGTWLHPPANLQVGRRSYSAPSTILGNRGFRVARIN